MKGIIFSAPMVRAIAEGRKTQTRRLVTPQPREHFRTSDAVCQWYHPTKINRRGEEYPGDKVFGFADEESGWVAPLKPGETVYVRETWRPDHDPALWDVVRYKADGAIRKPTIEDTMTGMWFSEMCDAKPAYRSPLMMPAWAARFHLTITDVRVQRVQEISEGDAVAEGVYRAKSSGRFADNYAAMAIASHYFATARGWYADLWDRLHGSGSWEANPWVWAYTFSVKHVGGVA